MVTHTKAKIKGRTSGILVVVHTFNSQKNRSGFRTVVPILFAILAVHALSHATDAQCPGGEIPDCNGNCAPADWVGDGFCDDGSFNYNGVPIYFNCPQFNCDDGDCDLILDCNGNCAPADWVGDGFCDDGSFKYNGIPIYLNCEQFNFDDGDCDQAPGDFALFDTTPFCDTTPPAGPAVQLNWTPSSDATSYSVYRNGGLYASGITGTSFLNNANLNPGQTYSYFIRAINSAGTQDSNTINVFISNDICLEAPPPPTNLQAIGSSNDVLMTWTDNATNEDGFVIERKTGPGGQWNYLTTVPANPGTGTVDFQNTGLPFGNTYYYRVYAFNSAGNSNYSDEAGATTLATPVLTAPANGATISSYTVTLEWNSVTGAEVYGIDMGTGGCGSTDVLDSQSSSATSYTTSLPDGTYYWRVKAANGSAPGISDASPCRSFTISETPIPTAAWTTPPPTSVTAGEEFTVAFTTSGDPTHVNIHWDSTDPTADGCCLNDDTTSDSTLSPTSSPAVLTAPTLNVDGSPISVPTSVLYVVHVSNSAGHGYSDIVATTVEPIGQQAGEIHVSPLALDFECGSGIMGPPTPGGGAGSPPDGGIAGGDTASPPAGDLRPRAPIVKPEPTIVDPQRHEQNVILVKFQDDLPIRLRDGRLTDFGAGLLDEAQPVLEGLAREGWWRHLTSVAEIRVDEMRATAEANLGQKVADMNTYFYLHLPEDVQEGAIIDAFNELEIVEFAGPVPIAAPPSMRACTASAPVASLEPPDFQLDQGYLQASPTGIDAFFAWNELDARGEGINVLNIDWTLNDDHEDLPVSIIHLGPMPHPTSGLHHGTATFGVLGSLNNAWGTTGICSESQLYYHPARDIGSNSVWLDGIVTGASLFDPGDIILIEVHIAGPNHPCGGEQCGFVPVEWWKPAYDAIVIAVQQGINVIVPAGNGEQHLDDPTNGAGSHEHWPFLPKNDSGSIMVGAGAAPTSFGGTDIDRSRLWFSNYGQRVNVQGWGERVWTTGYGPDICNVCCEYYDVQGPNLYYTGCYGGTSSASPIVSGAAALLQSAYKAEFGTVFSPDVLREILIQTGSPQQSGTYPASQTIGPRPNVAAAWSELSHSFTITNNGNGPLTVESIALDAPAPWIAWNAPQTPFEIEPAMAQIVTVNVDCGKAPEGETTRQLLVTSDDPDPGQSPYPDGVFIHVNNPSAAVPPLIAGIPDATIQEPNPYIGPTPTLIQGTPPISWSLISAPQDMTIDPSTGVVFWPGSSIFGSPHTITIRASNDAGFDEASWLLTVLKPGDLNGDGVVNVDDLLIVLNNWGACGDCGDCPADITGDCTVNVDDLLMVLNNWG